jgi:hypothetical protein
MTIGRPPGNRRISVAIVAGFVLGGVVAWTTPGVRAIPASGAVEPFTLDAQVVAGWRITPPAARPGEVVHIRFPLPAGTTGTQDGPAPLIGVAFLSDLGHPTLGRFDLVERTFGADLVVPPGTQWGSDPIVVWRMDSTGITGSIVAGRSLIVQLPFIATRSAQPPLWVR